MSVKVYALLHPFKTERIERDVEAGKSLRWIIADVAPREKDPTIFRCFVNDELVTNLSHIPADGDRVALRAVPKGGGNVEGLGWAGIGITGLGIALMFVPGAQLIGMGLIMSGAGMFMTAVGIDMGWFVPEIGGMERAEGAQQIRGSRNRVSQYAPVPVVLGKHIIVPPLGNIPYTTQSAAAQYLNQLFILGYGPLRVSDVRIGETQIFELSGGETPGDGTPFIDDSTVYEECTIEIRCDDEPMELIPLQVTETTVNLELLQSAGATVRDTADGVSMLAVDILFPYGLVNFNSEGKKNSRSVEVKAYYKVYGAGDETYTLFPAKEDTTYIFTGKTTEAVRYTFTQAQLSPGKYTVKVERVTADTSDTTIHDAVYWTYLRAYEMADNIAEALRPSLVRLALRCKATNQLNGVIDQLNLVAESIVPDYDGSGTGAEQWTAGVTSNPASLYLYMLRGAVNPNPVPDASIDWPAFEAWHIWCAANGFACNTVLTKGEPLIEVLRKIASPGRAAPSMIDGKYSIVHDIAKTAIVQHFTPRNSSGFQGMRVFKDIPHALKINFVNADVGYQSDQCIVYDDGYTVLNATRFETIDLWGVTDYDQAWKIGRYKLAEAKLRPELFTITVDWENLICTRGDRVKLSHDVILIGLAAGRVKALTQDATITAVTVDEACVMEAGKTYAVRFRTASGTLLKAVDTVVGSNTSLTFSVPADLGSIAAGDLFSFGETDLETLDCLVVGIEPRSDFAAKISLVEYAAGVFTADSGEIPTWTSNITAPADLPYAPQAPTILSVRSDGTVLVKMPDGTWVVRMLVTLSPVSGLVPIAEYELQYRTKDTDEEWKIIKVPADQTQIWVEPVEELFTYSLRVRAVSAAGVFSDWATTEHTVVGKTSAPNDVASISGTVRGVEGIALSWPAVADQDVSHYEVRVGASWAAGDVIFSGLALSYLWEVQTAATYNVMVKAVDTSGNESVTEAYTSIAISAPGAVQSLVGVVSGFQAILAWAPPATGDLPVKEYAIYKGDTFGTAEYLGKVAGTKFTAVETVLDDYTYWVVAVDQAGNEGTESYVAVVVNGKLSDKVYVDDEEDYVTDPDNELSTRSTRRSDGFYTEIYDGSAWQKVGNLRTGKPSGVGLDCWLRFAGDVTDSSGEGNNGTAYGTPSYGEDIDFGPYIELDSASSQYVELPATIGDSLACLAETEFSVMFLHKPRYENSGGILLSKADGASQILRMYIAVGQVFINAMGSGDYPLCPASEQWNQWIGLAWDGTTLKAYVDGLYYGDVNVGATESSAGAIYLGRLAGGAGSMFFNGRMYDFRTYTRALSAAEMFSVFCSGKASVTASHLGPISNPSAVQLCSDGIRVNGDVKTRNISGNAPVFGCRAWVNFDGTTDANVYGTYSRSGTSVMVTVINHGHKEGDVIYFDATSGAAADGVFTVDSVVSKDVFTFTHGTSGTTSGDCTLRRRLIRASGNVSSVTYRGTGLFAINFSTEMPDANYACGGAVSREAVTAAATQVPDTLTAAAYTFSVRDVSNGLRDGSVNTIFIVR